MGRAGIVSGTREWLVTGLPYIIVYEPPADREELMLGVYHGAQLHPGQPGRPSIIRNWQSRPASAPNSHWLIAP
jgi:hypothetical protein